MVRLRQSGEIAYYTIDLLEETGLVKHCFTTKRGGVSKGHYESMNLRFHCDDAPENVRKNFSRLADAIGVDVHSMVCSNQVHESQVVRVGRADCGNGLFFENRFESADALMTNEPGVTLVTFYADCVPIYFLDPVKRVIALAHSGWKGTVSRIGAKTVERMHAVYGTDARDVLCAIGPSIGVCHFEVGDEVAECFMQEFGASVLEKHQNRYHVNLQKAVADTLLASGILPEHLEDSGICTYCNSDLLFSHRKTAGKRGNLAAVLALSENI